MAELLVICGVLGLAVLIAWPILAANRRKRSPHDQPQTTSTRHVPPRDPDTPIPGSREHRRQQGKP